MPRSQSSSTRSNRSTGRRRFVAVATCGFAAVILAAAASTAPDAGAAEGGAMEPRLKPRVLPFVPTRDVLPNGLKVVTVKTDAKGIIAYYTVVRTGSRDEVEKGRSGYAHFFEHMMFRGTKKFPPEKYGEIMQKHGADGNAYTSLDVTAYHVVAPKSALADLVAVESDRFRNLEYPEPAFKTEAGAVLGEYNKSRSRPGSVMWEALSETAFTKHTYGHTTIGYEADVKAMPGGFKYSRKFFANHYTPDNCTVMVVGDISREELMPLVEKHYGDWKGKRIKGAIPEEPEQTEERRKHLGWHSDTPPMVYIGWKIPAFSVEKTDSAAIDVLGELLFGHTSALYKKLVLDEARVLELDSTSGWHMRDPHLFIVDAKYKDVADTDAIIDAIQAELDAAASGKLDALRIEKIKSHARYNALMRLETVTHIAELLTDYIVLTGEPTAAETHLQRLSEVSATDVARVAKEFLRPERRTIITLAFDPDAAKGKKGGAGPAKTVGKPKGKAAGKGAGKGKGKGKPAGKGKKGGKKGGAK